MKQFTHDEYTKKARRKIEDYLRKDADKQMILFIARMLKMELVHEKDYTAKQSYLSNESGMEIDNYKTWIRRKVENHLRQDTDRETILELIRLTGIKMPTEEDFIRSLEESEAEQNSMSSK